MTIHADMADEQARQHRRAVSRRGFLRAAAAGVGAGVLAACGVTTAPTAGTNAGATSAAGEAGGAAGATAAPAAAGSGPTLEFWAFSEDRLKFVRELITTESWTSKVPGATVNFRVFAYNDMHDKLLAALASGAGAPDIADVEISRFSRFIKGERVGFQELNERIGSELDNLYAGAAVDPWSWQGKIYGLGNELNTCVLAYRKDIMDELGITYPFETWDQVREAGQQIVAGGKGKFFAVHDISFGDWYMLSQSAGTTMFDEAGDYQGANDKSVTVMQFLHDLVYVDQIAGIAPTEAADSWAPPTYKAAFAAEQFVGTWGPPWHFGGLFPAIPDQVGKWTAQKMPSGLGDGKPTANFGGTGQTITEQSQNPDAAWELLRLCNLTTEGVLTDFRIRTAYPAYKPAYEDQALLQPSEPFGGQKIGELYQSIANDLPAFRQSPVWPEATEAMNRIVITPVMQDKADAKTALTELGTEIERLKNA